MWTEYFRKNQRYKFSRLSVQKELNCPVQTDMRKLISVFLSRFVNAFKNISEDFSVFVFMLKAY